MNNPVYERELHRFQWRTIIWSALFVVAAITLLVSIPFYIQQLGKITPSERVRLAFMSPVQGRVDVSEFWLDLASMSVQLAVSAACIGLAALVFRRRPRDRMALLMSSFLLLFSVFMTGPLQTITEGNSTWFPVVGRFEAVLFATWAVLFYLFPNGLYYPSWTRFLALALLPWMVITLLFRDFFSPMTAPETGQLVVVFGWYMVWPLSMLVAQALRYRYGSTPLERQQTKWVIVAFISLFGAIAGMFLLVVSSYVLKGNQGLQTILSQLSHGAGLVWFVLLSLMPLAMGVALLRYRLWDIDIILNRTLVYGTLTALVLCVYLLTVEGVNVLVNPTSDLLVSLFATGLVIVTFLPLRDRLQHAVNRLIYGDRDDPYAVFSRLGARLRATLTPEAALPAILETVTQALKLPYAAIGLQQGDDEQKLAAEYGLPPRNGRNPKAFEVFPLIYRNANLGELIVATRTPGEALTPTDRRLLQSVADQAGGAVYTVRLMRDLQASREGLVMAREEERRRLRRDLHDGLGSALASLSYNLDAARNLLPPDAGATEALLVELKTQTQAAIADIRRLIYDLRPPALDELGLVPALQQYVDQVSRPAYLSISIQAGNLPILPAAVEVAAYRIVLEALTNVLRHADAKHCTIRLTQPTPVCLALEILDDGKGISENRLPGIGLSTMRARAEELGGSFEIETNPTGGLRVAVRLPLETATQDDRGGCK